jgi:DNA-binding MarR family transcriptional regulator
MDRTTLTAHLKVLERRQLVVSRPDARDRRVRRVGLTAAGRMLLSAALPLWEEAQAETETRLAAGAAAELRGLLARVA